MGAPWATQVGATSLVLQWAPPLLPNGVLTGYTLYMGGTAVYNGALLSFAIYNLNVGFRIN